MTPIRTQTGRDLDELTIEALRTGVLTTDDFRISRAQMERQAAAAEEGGYRQLAENLRRAAEMTALQNERVLQIYAMLRPGRATHAELASLAGGLEGQGMPRLAAFVREAAEVYRQRGITRVG
jgi:propanediol dehydratase small subunit